MKIQWKKLIPCLLIPVATGGLSALLAGGMKDFETVNQPPLSPPGWLFPIAWTVLYLLMGLASYLVLTGPATRPRIHSALIVYGIQLAVNFFWSIFFFRFDAYLFSFFWLLLLWVLILVTIGKFAAIRRAAGWLLVPYLIWVTFAGYLNLGVYLLN